MTDEVTKARLTVQRAGDGLLQVELAGDWLARAGLPDFALVEKEFTTGLGPIKAMRFETRDLGRWDTGLMVFVLKCFNLCRRNNVEFQAQTLPPGVSALFQLSQAVPEVKEAARTVPKKPFFERLGLATLSAYQQGTADLTFVGESLIAFFKLLRGKAQFRWADALLVMQETGPRALGIVALINFIIGMILAFVGATQLQKFGASIYTADLVGIASVREMGCIMTGIIMSGRTGAAFAAQLGTMKVNQEIEAFQTFGFNPIEFLVLPRMLALILMMPVLVLFADLISILGGLFVSTLMLNVTPGLYINRTIHTITATSFLLGIFKGTIFGVIVALTGCMRGIQCGTDAAAVGLATTSAVVTGITAIIASDGVFAVLSNAFGI